MRSFIFTDPNNGNNGFQSLAAAVQPPEVRIVTAPASTITKPGGDPFTNMQCKNLEANMPDGYNIPGNVEDPPFKVDFRDMFPPPVAVPRDGMTGNEGTTGLQWFMDFAYLNGLNVKEVSIPTWTKAKPGADATFAYTENDSFKIADVVITASQVTAFKATIPSTYQILATGGVPASYKFTVNTGSLPAGVTLSEDGLLTADATTVAGTTAVTFDCTDGVTTSTGVSVSIVIA